MKTDGYLGNLFINIYSLTQKSAKLKKIKAIMYYVDKLLTTFISKPKYMKDKKKKVLIIFNLALGDGVIFLNAIKNIRKVYPHDEYELNLTCQKGLEKIFDELHVFDYIIPLNYNKATVNLKERFLNLKVLRKEYYDIVLDPVGANSCMTNVLMTKVVCGKTKIGCLIDNINITCPKSILKNTYTNLKKIKEKSLIEQYYAFFYDEYKIEYMKLPREKAKVKLPKQYYIVFPSASQKLKRWPIEKYAQIVKKIYKKTNMPLVLCGTERDREDYKELVKLIGKIPVIDIIGKTSLLEFIDVISKAKFVITNDTSTYHIAVINQVPVAIITGGYTYDRYVSYDFKDNSKYKKPYIIVNQMKCFNCNNNCSKINKNNDLWPCLDKITTNYAWKIIEKMIDDIRS